MKKVVLAVIGLCVLIGVCVCCFAREENVNAETGFIRIHVRANSNSEGDQRVKYEVKEAVVDYLTPLIAEGETFEFAYEILKQNLENIEKIANDVLERNGYLYVSKAKLNQEYFPTRSYGEITLENGFYDALILELGSGEGDNWWCVVYPPLCFIGAEGNDYKNIKYKSKLVEIVQKFFN